MRVLSLIAALFACWCIACLWTSAKASQTSQEQKIEIHHDLETDVLTARLARFRIADDNGPYHSFDLSASYTYPFKSRPTEPKVDLALYSVVKGMQLNSDLYVVFVVDGKEVHFGSNRSAIRNPAPGRRWIGERMVFSVPLEDFRKLAAAKQLAIKIGSVTIELNEDARTSLKVFADTIGKTLIRASSSPQKTFLHPLSFAQARGGYRGKRSTSEFA